MNKKKEKKSKGLFTKHSVLFSDLYLYTMAQGHFLQGQTDTKAVFDYFFRTNPFNGGFVIFAGLQDLLQELENLSFEDNDIKYLRSIGFKNDFLDYLKNFKFSATIFSVKEGEIVFPNEPILRIDGNIIETQIVETLVLNFLNFASLIATKAARISIVSENRSFIDFGLRRAQSLGGILASKAAIIGGASATSNMFAGYKYNLEVSGTQAHAWVQSFDNELTAFRKYAAIYPKNCVLLVDTYDTLKSGIPNAIIVGKELEDKGYRLKGIRLDSGDLAYLSKKARKMLDSHGLNYVKIAASNQLDEYLIQSLLSQNAPIDFFGIGTELITGKSAAALDGVYKLAMINDTPKLKISDNLEKITLPGNKVIARLIDKHNKLAGDGVFLENETDVKQIYHALYPEKSTNISKYKKEYLYQKVMDKGKICIQEYTPIEIQNYVKERLLQLPDEHKRFSYPHVYKVGISKQLMNLRIQIVNEWRNTF